MGFTCKHGVPGAGVRGKASGGTKKLGNYHAAVAASKVLIKETRKPRAEFGRQRRQSYRRGEKQKKKDQTKRIKSSPLELTNDIYVGFSWQLQAVGKPTFRTG